jgi:hypothetical protein
MQNTGKRSVILLFFIILRWSFNYESNVFRYNKILIDCVFGNSKFLVPSTLTINLGFASVNSQCLRDNKLAIPSYPVNKYIIFSLGTLNCMDVLYCPTSTAEGNITHPCNSRYRGKMFLYIDHGHIEYLLYYILIVK